MIEVNLAILAEAANTSAQSQLNILGEFNSLVVVEPPWGLVGRVLVVRFVGNPADAGPHIFALRLVDQDRELVWASSDAQVEFPKSRITGIPARLQAISPLPPILLPSEGGYELEILVDGVVKDCIELYCILQSNMPADAGD